MMLKRSFQMSLFGLAVALMLTFTSAQAQAQWVGFTTAQVVSVQPFASNTTSQNIPGAIWAFNTANGTFLFYPAQHLNPILGLPPYVGQYQVQGNRVIFRGVFRFQNGTGSVITQSASGEVSGYLDLGTGRLTMDWTSGQISVGGTLGGGYGLGGGNTQRIEVIVKRAF